MFDLPSNFTVSSRTLKIVIPFARKNFAASLVPEIDQTSTAVTKKSKFSIAKCHLLIYHQMGNNSQAVQKQPEVETIPILKNIAF